MNKLVLVIACTLIGLGSHGQSTPVNLVPNGGFEEHSGCPSSHGQLWHCEQWEYSTGSPDYYHKCGTGTGAAPSNIFGYQEPIDSAYLGLFGYTDSYPGGEVAWSYLTQPLLSGHKYQVKFKASYADSASFTICCVGAILSATSPPAAPYLNNLSDVELVVEDSIDTITWFEMSQEYTAIGGEDKIFLGSFRPEIELNVIEVNDNPNYNKAYFYIDNVSVTLIDTVTSVRDKMPVSFQLNSNLIRDNLQFTSSHSLQLDIMDMSGRVVLSENVNTGRSDIDIALPNGIYIAVIKNDGVGFYHTEKIVVQR